MKKLFVIFAMIVFFFGMNTYEVFGQKTTFKVWKTIKLGTCKDVGLLHATLKAYQYEIAESAENLLSKSSFTLSLTEEEIQLVNVSVADLGFSKDVNHGEIYAKAKELGLELCPSEVGPQLRLQYKDQPKDEWLLIAMEPIVDSYGELGIFKIECYVEDYCMLGASPVDIDDKLWSINTRFIFCLRK